MNPDVLQLISSLGEEEIEAAARAVSQRYCQLFPQWEVVFLSFEKGRGRQEQLERMIEMLISYQSSSCKETQ